MVAYLARWMLAEIGTLDQVAFLTPLPPNATHPFSFTFWYCAIGTKRTQVIANIGDWFVIRLENDQLICELNSIALAIPAPSVGLWHHVGVMVADAIQLTIDGILIQSQDIHSITLPTAPELRIGGYTDSAGGHFDHTFGRNQSGWVDDVRWYNHALESNEIADLIPANVAMPSVGIQADHPTFTAIPSQIDTFHSYLWDFGDGSSAIGAVVSHDYAFSGTYTVRLIALTHAYQQAICEQTITITGKQERLPVTPVFVNGTEGYACYRIPSIICATNGDLVAFAEARLESCSDSTATIRLVCKRSNDGGKTWSALQIVAQNIVNGQEHVVQNSAPVVDSVYGTGRIFVLYNKMEHSEWDLSTGTGTSRICYSISDDHGQTWHHEEDITAQVQRPEWRVQRPSIGHGIQLKSGRLFFAGMFTADQQSVFQSQNYVFWSDDLGVTWTIGNTIAHIGLNEAIAVGLEDGSVMINSRAYQHEKPIGCRGVTIGHFMDDMITFEPTIFDENLICPAVQASIIRYTSATQADYGGKSRLLFSNPNHPKARFNLTVRLSYDEGKTWAISKTIDDGASAYSDLVIQDDMQMGVLYERGNQGGIAYRSFSLDWLTDGQDTLRKS